MHRYRLCKHTETWSKANLKMDWLHSAETACAKFQEAEAQGSTPSPETDGQQPVSYTHLRAHET